VNSRDESRAVVITGSASGIGLGLAREFLARGHRVMLSDLRQADLDAALAGLDAGDAASAQVCDVSDREQLQALWQGAAARFGRVDFWFNNAGVGSDQSPVAETAPQILQRVIDTNIKGVVYGSQVAAQGMLAQAAGGFIYNTAGFGANGFWRPGMTIYGTSKRAVVYFSRGLSRELKGSGVRVGWLNPGMVITPLVIEEAKIMSPEQWRAGRRVFNMWGETVETTARAAVDRILANERTGVDIRLLPGWKMALRSLRSLFVKRDLFREHGV
jgi:NAD(P)-dependent dehydrogenase (short-subunit alcohol dehydrogenase family)